MLTEERHDRIRRRLQAEGRVVAAELAAEFQVSEDTVRRDLRELARSGECRRVYGGALPPAPDYGPLAARRGIMAEDKLRLATVTAGLVTPGQTIFIDAGSTNLAIAAALPRDLRATVVTNVPQVALVLEQHACDVLLLGGQFDRDKGACLGLRTLRDIEGIHADLFVLGTCGVDAATGVTALYAEEAEIKRAMVEQSRQLIVPATIDKLGTTAPFAVAPVERIDHLVVAGDADLSMLTAFETAGVELHRA